MVTLGFIEEAQAAYLSVLVRYRVLSVVHCCHSRSIGPSRIHSSVGGIEKISSVGVIVAIVWVLNLVLGLVFALSTANQTNQLDAISRYKEMGSEQ